MKYSFSGFLQRRRELVQLKSKEAQKKRAIINGFRRLFKKYEVKRAYLFGSILRQSCLPNSDIDLYIEDLPAERYWDLWRDLEDKADQPIDLYCQLDDPIFVEKIKKRGELIYEG